MTDFNQASAYIAAIAGDVNTAVIDFRAIHDVRKDIPAIPIRGTLAECWNSLVGYNGQGYGIFATVAALDGNGRELANVSHIRAHYVDLDDLSAQQNYEKAVAFDPPPSFAVHSSNVYDQAGEITQSKYHVYWPVAPYVGNDRFQLLQRKFKQMFSGDKSIIDATRVMRLPGTIHSKMDDHGNVYPHLVTCHALGGYGVPLTVEQLETALSHVNVIDGAAGVRHDLGEPSLAAPSLAWLERGLELIDPNQLDRAEWVSVMSAVKQSGWTLTDPDNLYRIFSDWCARYENNDLGENLKQWNSIRNTEVGWPSMLRRVPTLQAALAFGGTDRTAALTSITAPVAAGATPTAIPEMPVNEPPPLDCKGEYLTHLEQQEWFKGCYSVTKMGKILSADGRFMNSTEFNMRYGGKMFIINSEGKKTDEAWKAATRSTMWTIPKVDHIRFDPTREYGAIINDSLGRKGVNTYQPSTLEPVPGDVTPFTRHMEAMFSNEHDRNLIYMYLAHNVKFPGHKIRWSPVIQSVEGVGKGFIQEMMGHILGEMYCYSPKAQELVKSGATFNAWMRGKLMIIVNEIKVDEKRELVEILKPMITDKRVEVQSKGVDQDMEDNPANWIFFSNFKDCIPINVNGRRYAVLFSDIQSHDDLVRLGMNDEYFNSLFAWLESGGAANIAHWLMQHSVTKLTMPQRAPLTSSRDEAIELSRSPIERVILDSIEDQLPGFRGGWVSVQAVVKRVKATGATKAAVSSNVITPILEKLGYKYVGRCPIEIMQEGIDGQPTKPHLYFMGGGADVNGYATMQGWV